MTKCLLFVFRILSASALICAALGILHAGAGDRTISQFVHTAWSAKDGAPGNITALAQTADGFLWLGTQQGLYRFDGVSFERYEPQSGPPFQSSSILALLALPDGDLWIGFSSGGLSQLRGGKNTDYSNSDGVPPGRVMRLVQDRAGTIWAGAEGGLARFQNNRWTRVGDDWGFPGGKAAALYVDRQGTLWVAAQSTVVFLPSGATKFQTTGIPIGQVFQIAESPRGMLWMAETTRSVHPLALPASEHSVQPEIKVGSVGILFDDDDSLWITSIGDGMRRVPFPDRLKSQKINEHNEAIESFTAKDGLASDYATCILKDREGSIWVGTSAGLDRFRRGALVPIVLPAKFFQKTLVAGDDGQIWAGSMSAALARVQGNTWKIQPSPSVVWGVRDSSGAAWLLDTEGRAAGVPYYRLLRMEGGKPTRVAEIPDVFHDFGAGAVLAADRAGTLWLVAGSRGLFFLKGGRWEPFQTPDEIARKPAQAAFADAAGRVWFGFTGNTILALDGPNVRTFSANDGVQVGTVKAITGCGGHIWIGGESGLEVWQGGRFRAVTPADGDAFRGVSGIQEDAAGDLLFSEERGVVYIPATEISKILKNPAGRVRYEVFDQRDGLPGTIQQSGLSSAQGTDGRIWFSTSAGLVWTDPAQISRKLPEPPITIRSITANGQRYASLAGLKLPSRTRDLTIDYTALSLAAPERVRFRYKLEGSDREWQDAGTRRQAFYTNLSPLEYRFRVMASNAASNAASNNDGVWNEAGASVSFSIAPAYYQTTWFEGVSAAAGVGMLWFLYRLRLRQLTARIDMLYTERLEERSRIARELHDTLLQSFHGVMLRFQAVYNLLPARGADARQILKSALDDAAQAITQARDAVQDLRSSTTVTSDLPNALEALGAELAAHHGAAGNASVVSVHVEGAPLDVHPILRDEIYRIAGEALRNAVHHARSRQIEVEIRYDPQQLRVRVRDNGIGIDPALLCQEGRPGHWGLKGMRERASRIGGQLEVWSEQGAGTEVELTLPAAVAYANSAGRRFRLFSGKAASL